MTAYSEIQQVKQRQLCDFDTIPVQNLTSISGAGKDTLEKKSCKRDGSGSRRLDRGQNAAWTLNRTAAAAVQPLNMGVKTGGVGDKGGGLCPPGGRYWIRYLGGRANILTRQLNSIGNPPALLVEVAIVKGGT